MFANWRDVVGTVVGAALLAGAPLLLIHEHVGQVLFTLMVAFGVYLIVPNKAEKFAKLADRFDLPVG